jgi:hypothetical protein
MTTPFTRSITVSAAAGATSTIEYDSRMSIRPTSELLIPPSLAMAPTRSPGRALSREPTLTNRRVIPVLG